MACDVVETIQAISVAYYALRRNCAPDADLPVDNNCIVPFLLNVYGLAKGISEREGITETTPRPELPTCLSESFLMAMKAWIEGMMCEPATPDWSILHIRYEWDAPANDLDTCTEFLGSRVGWSPDGVTCTRSAPYVTWSGDNQLTGPELVDIDVKQAFRDGKWSGSVSVQLRAGWYIPAGGSGPARIMVWMDDSTVNAQGITISPGSQDDCAATAVGTIRFYADGTFTLDGA